MIKIQLLFFGICTDLIGTSSLEFEISTDATISAFKVQLLGIHPQLENINSYAIAVNEEYASNETVLKENDVVAIIPPVSGG